MPEYNVAVKLHKNYPVNTGLFIRKVDIVRNILILRGKTSSTVDLGLLES